MNFLKWFRRRSPPGESASVPLAPSSGASPDPAVPDQITERLEDTSAKQPDQGYGSAENRPRVYVTSTRNLKEDVKRQLVEELGLTGPILEAYLELLEIRQIPSASLDTTLREMAKSYGTLNENLAKLTSSDPTVNAIYEQVLQALGLADFARVEALLNDATDHEVKLAETLPTDEQRPRMLSAAAAKAANGQLKMTQIEYREAAEYFREAVEFVPPDEELVLANYLHELGVALRYAGDYREAEGPLTRALAIRRRLLPEGHFDLAATMYQLAWLYTDQGRYAEAEELYLACLKIYEAAHGPQDLNVAATLNNLAGLYETLGRYDEAEPLYLRDLAISEKALGPEHPDVAITLNNLAGLYEALGRDDEAEPLRGRAAAIESDAR